MKHHVVQKRPFGLEVKSAIQPASTPLCGADLNAAAAATYRQKTGRSFCNKELRMAALKRSPGAL